MPRKCRLRAKGGHGDPGEVLSGATRKTMNAYVSCCSASYGWKFSNGGTPRLR
jgi:hypothetical protein